MEDVYVAPRSVTDWVPGEVCGLVEEGGFAVVLVLSRAEEPSGLFPDARQISYKVKFLEIGSQFPFVPFVPGDELTVSVVVWKEYPNGYPGGWEFVEVRKREL